MQSLLVLLLLLNVYTSLAQHSQAPLTPCTANGLLASYDVIVVGSGPGGSVAARRLAENNPTWNILLLERGIAYAACTTCQSSTNINTLSETVSGPFIYTTPQPHVNNLPMLIKDASVQGGGTSVNTGYHLRGDAPRYYAQYFPFNWNWQIMQLYYKKYENYTFPANFHDITWTYTGNLRSHHGPVDVTQIPLRSFERGFLAAIKNEFPTIPTLYDRSLNDGEFPGIGAACSEVPAILNPVASIRVSAYTAYIRSYQGSNLKSVYNTLVDKVLFNGNAASGVKISFNANVSSPSGMGSCTVQSSRVVVSAGAYGTPKLLQLSGVGPAAELRRFGIPLVSDVPELGSNLDDHFTLFNTYTGYKDNLVVQNAPDVLTSATYNTEDNPAEELEFMINTSASGPGKVTLTIQRTNMHARGNVTLASTNPNDPPVINPNYFGDLQDKNAAAIALFKLRKIAVMLNLTNVADPCTGSDCSTPNATLATYLSKNVYFVGLHYTATASICAVTNPLSLRVAGTSGLYVLDASIMPATPAAAPMASLYAVAERGIELINTNMHLDRAGAEFQELLGWSYCLLEI